MDAFELTQVAERRAQLGTRYYEFLRRPALSVGLYALATGSEDLQQPHTEDEIYHVVRGQAMIRVGEEDQPVGPGSVVYVAAGVPHRFHSIAHDLEVLVVFAPAQHTNRAAG